MIKLNLGSGKRNIEGYVNIDAIKHTEETVVGNVLGLTDYEDASVDVIHSEHVVEHFTRPELNIFFSECSRLLKTGGKLCIIAPSLKSVIEEYLIKKDITYLDNFLYGLHEHMYDFHKQGIYEEKFKLLCIKYNLIVEEITYQSRVFSSNEIVLKAFKH